MNWAMYVATRDIDELWTLFDTVAGKADSPHAIGGDDHDASTLAELNAKVSDATLASESVVATGVETHRTGEVHNEAQPPQTHGNAKHAETFAVDGDAQPPEAHDHTEADETTVPVGGIDMVSVVVDDPDRLPAAELQDGESIEMPIPVDDGETLEVYRWGAYDASDHTAPTGLDVELVDGGDVVQVASNTTNSQDTANPVASYQNSSGAVQVFKLRAKNDSGSPIGDGTGEPGVGSHFGFRVV
ncbi:hypothetical protein SAMN05192561_11265 [Halopenitus malekzadehii]|uniref:Uncharacterized protein n=1 Tax=Halopenitus malekzadehii TaxID=1267564 RepID=A0A1H6JPP2_9EURY|nr:hypothetical protein [Halopenitus malekzadehii]SEH61033.1 hypothetical protein SAMN05192561_11265 [Halopenitus malekzadehii]